jgi:2-dehydro-3-deoxygalactonokinase
MTQSTFAAARLIGLDWGSTGLRAFLIGAEGHLLDTRDAALGASVLQGAADYTRALQELAGDWMQAHPDLPNLPIIACGMVGSKHGWLEAPYAACPSGVTQLVQGLRSVPGTRVCIVPGLLYEPADAAPDVLRGEETQVVGALQTRPELAEKSCIVLPGTHSKWVDIQHGQVLGFATHMTGELFAVLRQHSVLGRLMADSSSEENLMTFLSGVDAVRKHGDLGLTHQLFAVRTLGLTERMPTSGLHDYLSGLLIGHELRSGMAWRRARGLGDAPLVLVGEPALCRRYAQALQRFGLPSAQALPNTAPAGLWQLALAAGLVTSSVIPSSSIATEPLQ